MLPTAFPTARIFTIDWPASLFKERSTIEMKITELARSLLLSIQSRPGADESRPLLFIASCLGGIVLIQAIVIAARSEKKYTSLWRATGGIVFLATPFRGTAFQDIAEAAVTFLRGYARLADKQVTELLDSAKASTCFLEDLVGEFTQTCQQRDQPCELAIFYENKKGNLLRKVPLLSRVADILSKPKLVSLKHCHYPGHFPLWYNSIRAISNSLIPSSSLTVVPPVSTSLQIQFPLLVATIR